eukprot:1193093-Prorocentrum_minimum.AAC.3
MSGERIHQSEERIHMAGERIHHSGDLSIKSRRPCVVQYVRGTKGSEFTTQKSEFTCQGREFTTQKSEFTCQGSEFTTQKSKLAANERALTFPASARRLSDGLRPMPTGVDKLPPGASS